MRVIIVSLVLVGLFIGGVMCIPMIFPNSSGGVRGTVALFWFFALIGTGLALNARKLSTVQIRDYLLYTAIALALVAMAGVTAVHDADRGIHREFKNDWTVAIMSAVIGFGAAAKQHWRYRKEWFFWTALLGLLGAHFAILIPILSPMEKVPLLWGGPLAYVDTIVASTVLGKLGLWRVSVEPVALVAAESRNKTRSKSKNARA